MRVMYNRYCRYDKRLFSFKRLYYGSNYHSNGVTKDNVVTTVVTTRVVLQCSVNRLPGSFILDFFARALQSSPLTHYP